MYSKSRLAFQWIQYALHASNSRGHGIHSPFVYELVREVLQDRRSYYAFEQIEKVKKNLLRDHRVLQVHDPGAGSNRGGGIEIKVSAIADRSVSSKKFGRLLFRLSNYCHARTIIEMGSSLGISAAYLASADTSARVITLEGSPPIAGIAKETFHHLGLKNIEMVCGNFDETLDRVIAENPPADLVFLDGNHRKKPVLAYFEKLLDKMAPSSCIIIHDIHWSGEMEEAWDIIRDHPRVKMSIDIFSAGLVFFRNEFRVKQEFMIRF
jgi:predicted O-methyltransferase YrrM